MEPLTMESGQANAGFMRGGCCCLNASHEQPILLESNQNHATVQTGGVSTALPASAGMGGGYVPMITDKQPVYMSDRKGHNGVSTDGTATTLTAQEKERPMISEKGGDAMESVVRRLTPLE